MNTKKAGAEIKSEENNEGRLAVAVLSVMEALARVIEQETEVLEKQDMESLEPLRKEKAKWMLEYHSNMRALSQQPELLKAITKEKRDQLKQAGIVLADAAQRNAERLKTAILATQALVQTVMDTARKPYITNESYRDTRGAQSMRGSYSPTCTPVAVNQTA